MVSYKIHCSCYSKVPSILCFAILPLLPSLLHFLQKTIKWVEMKIPFPILKNSECRTIQWTGSQDKSAEVTWRQQQKQRSKNVILKPAVQLTDGKQAGKRGTILTQTTMCLRPPKLHCLANIVKYINIFIIGSCCWEIMAITDKK